ncbi:signal recognition particle, subunit SRP19 [Exophiala viscosa]|uniref:Signal recognition particle, subunit SRP19 n=1 Tax=Exophiala viscosa TaxID=2486360 RepID=A0AAN6DNN3_9EURO|nr:signal recognition particle, subunit SRP19 [Exophiala viscosa]
MSHAQVEELSDSDPEIDDPSNFLPPSDDLIIRPVDQPSQLQPSQPSSRAPPNPLFGSSTAPDPTLFRPPPVPQQTRETIKTFQCLYPVYFDSTRTKAQGRRVSSNLAVPNPLAFNILAAARATIGDGVLQFAFEPDKTHPKDWANPGRIRVQLFDKDSHKPLHPTIKSKTHLYSVIGKWLKDHPTSKEDPLQVRIPGLPVPENFGKEDIPKPRGWKMGSILPIHSPAVSGGGVREDFFKEAMEEIRQAQSQGQLPAGMPGGGGGGGGMPDMAALQNMMSGMGMGGMGGMGGMPGLGGGGGMGGESSGGKKKIKKKG